MPSTPTPSADAGRVGGRAVVTGGAGFLGSWLCERLLDGGTEVVCVDNLATGAPGNLRHLEERPGFLFVDRDVSEGLEVDGPVDSVFHLASPASPVHYLRLPIETMRVGSLGTMAALELAERHRARFLLASTSEVYGDPLVHPQTEDYWGNVNPVGPRSCYDESKRYAEALCMAYARVHQVPVRIVRIFNTYGPRMNPNDGRSVPNFISQSIRNRPITIYGGGTQTRSYCYVSDMVSGLMAVMWAPPDTRGMVFNVGNPDERGIEAFARIIRELCGSEAPIEYLPPLQDDPSRRCPDITRIRT
ncbi:MAG TPA: NAD-dependent epimerase/dehydratase family protein, partial [Nocardioidaceae bacterium]